MSGLFSSLTGQNKIFDVVFNTYTEGDNSEITALDSLGVMLRKLQAQLKNAGDSWNWVSIDEIGTTINPDNGLKYTEEYFIDGVGGIQFCIKDNILWIRALYKMLVGVSGTGWQLFTITDPKYFPKLGPRNSTVIRPFGHQINAGDIRNLFTYYVDPDGYGNFMIHSAQTIPQTAIISILPTPIGFI
ncbi:hypothetical protein [Acinetobacter bereziniae]|uniref:hypothetical protein n=1 Tax=Acinetobacter bereziniae TaxID=106648 RepID=UPI003016B712